MNLKYNIEELQKVDDLELIGNAYEWPRNWQIIIDSRNYFGGVNAVFLALIGPVNNGHDFIEELYQKGCRYFIVSEVPNNEYQDAQFLKVEDTLLFLQKLATYHRSKFKMPVIAVTGSNGKTIVKEWLYHFLKYKYNIVRSPKSYNSQVGVPLSILLMSEQHNMAIIEAGISHPGEMDKLQKIIRPTHGILTALGKAHRVNFDSDEHLRLEKTRLFKELDTFYSFENNNEIIVETELGHGSSKTTFKSEGKAFEVQMPFSDEASLQNLATCVGFLRKWDTSPSLIQNASWSLPSIALRLEARQGHSGNTIIDDSYSSDLISLRIGLNHASKVAGDKNIVVILSDIAQDNLPQDELYREVAQLLQNRNITHLIGVGKQIFNNKEVYNTGEFFEDTKGLLEYLKDVSVSDSIIYIKGARNFGFEKVCKFFERKNHDTQLTIDLGVLRNNIKEYLKKINSDTKMLGMIKAYGYGSGSFEVAKVLLECGVSYLGVAYADEGAVLREAGVKTPIMVMNSEEGSFDKIIENQLEPSIFSFRQLDKFIRTLIDYGIKSYPVHIKLDTGMHRLGFIASEIEELISTLSSQPEVRVQSIFSHLAAAEIPREDLFTTKQIQKFQYASHKIETGLGYDCIKHILNSSGIERFSHAQFDMVRLGLGMYGSQSSLKNVEPIARLTTIISQIKHIKKGESVGYGRSQFALKDSIIGVIPIGYADGFSRTLSRGNGGVFVNGKIAPVFGSVCMDMTMIDLTDIPAKEGDEVEIFGKNKSINDFAKEMDTITYEVMTSISQRVVRVYVD